MANRVASPAPSLSALEAPVARGKKLWVAGAAVALLAGVGLVGMLRRGEPRAVAPQPVVFDPGVVELEPFVLNLADPTGDRYLRLRVSLVLDREESALRASAGLPQVKLRDRVLSTLATKRAAELASTAGKEELRAEILAMVEPLLAEPPFLEPGTDNGPAHVVEVFFTEFLLQ